jgi:hypothetical protein
MGDVTRAGEICEPECRVGRRFEKQHPCLGPEGGLDCLQIGRVDIREVELIFPQDALEQPVRTPVRLVGDHHVIAGLEHRHHRPGSRHSGGKRKRRSTVLDCCKVGFERAPGRVLRTPVFVALVAPQRLLHVGRGLIDRRDDCAGRRVWFLPRVDADSTESSVIAQLHDALTVL